MLDECRAVFAERLKEKGERLILDSYIPAEGTYLIVERDGSVGSITDLVKDKKTKEIDCSSLRASDLFYYDYYSQLISMNKPMDVKKNYPLEFLSVLLREKGELDQWKTNPRSDRWLF